MYDTAQALNMGERIALIPQLTDPKNLFSSLLPNDSVTAPLARSAPHAVV